MTTLSDRYVHTIWCDDIRQEVGNKPSFMGVITGALLLPSLPATLPRLCLHTWISTPIERPYKTAKLQVLRESGEVLVEMVLEGQPAVQAEVLADATRLMSAFGLTFGPIEISAESKWLVFRADLDGEVLDGPKLRFSADPGQYAAAMGSAIVAPLPSSNSPSDVDSPQQ